MSPFWLLVLVAVLFTSGTVAWCAGQSRVTSRQQRWRAESGLRCFHGDAAVPAAGQRANPVDLIPTPHQAPE
jgi:hypothetical protein